MPIRIFLFEITYLVLLIVLFFLYMMVDTVREALPSLGSVPIQVAWFGSVGGVLSGLGGVYFLTSIGTAPTTTGTTPGPLSAPSSVELAS